LYFFNSFPIWNEEFGQINLDYLYFTLLTTNLLEVFHFENNRYQKYFDGIQIGPSSDHLMGVIGFYQNEKNLMSLYQTKEKIILQVKNIDMMGDLEAGQYFNRPIFRYSFLPGQLFSETFKLYPLLNGKKFLYIDKTKVFSPSIELIEVNEAYGFISRIKNNLSVPGNCDTLNPKWNKENLEIRMICQDENEFFLQQIFID